MINNLIKSLLFCIIFSIALTSCQENSSHADNPYLTYEIKIKNHIFIPDIIEIPANSKVKLIVINEDDEAEEFESFSLHREKIIPGKSEAIIKIGPLEPGKYEFFGEFHAETAKGTIIAK